MAKYECSKPATKTEPCPICGKTDHCWSAYFGSKNGWLYYCAKGGQPAVFGRDGRKYLLKDTRAFPGGKSGGYHVYESEEQQRQLREEYIAELKAKNPYYKDTKTKSKNARYEQFVPRNAEVETIEVDHIDPLPNKQLHEIYSYLLSILILEDSHREALLNEWNAGLVNPNLGEALLKRWPIRSLPMNDYARKNCGARLKNKTRREIVHALVDRFGSLKGVPGFYLETIRWKDRVTGEPRESTHWQMVSLSGIVYPCYDADGYLYRIRIGDEHPVLEEYARDRNGNYVFEERQKRIQLEDGSWGIKTEKKHAISADIRWDYRTGEWYREDRTTKNRTIIYSPQKNIFQVSMTAKGYPKIDGKVDGKYKNFSSYNRKEEEKNGRRIAFNSYAEGCQSGSPVSLYTKEGDNMDFLYVTEGEKKAIVINEFLNCPVADLPGVHTFSKLFEKEYGKTKSLIERLVEKGLKAVIIVYDADKTTNDAVLSAEEGAIDKCRANGILTYVGEWNPHYGKGADDILIQGKSFEFYER